VSVCGRPPRGARLLVAAAITALCSPLIAAQAHEIAHTVTGGEATIVRLSYADGTPFAFEGYEIYRAEEDIPVQVGRTDREGRILFAADAPGIWRIRAFSEDGHGADLRLDLTGPGPSRESANSGAGRGGRILGGVGIILGVFGALALLRRKREATGAGGGTA